MPDCDAIVIGAGHNGLAAATILAKEGLRVLALEKNRYVGGMAATVELFEGFKFDVAASVLFPLADRIVEDLELSKYGLDAIESSVTSCMIGEPGDSPVIFYTDPMELAEHINRDHGPDAARGMMELFAFCSAPANAINRFAPLTPPRSPAEILAAASSSQERDALEICLEGSAMEVIDRFFPDPARHRVIRGFLAFMAVQSTYMGPCSPGSALCLAYAMATPGPDRFMRRIRGGMGALPEGLRRSIEEKGGEVRLNARVNRILIEKGRAIGVELADGEQITARAILSNLDANATLLRLVGEDHLPADLVSKVRGIDHRGAYIQIHFALDALPEFRDEFAFLNEKDLRASLGIFNTPEQLEQNWRECREGRLPENPPLGVQIPSVRDDTLAPPGRHAGTLFVFYFPCAAPREEHGRLKDAMAERAIDKMTRYAPNFRDSILHQATFAPMHYESMFGCTGGDFCHGLVHPDQMLDARPVPGWTGYTTPVDNLFICGSACHPGPGVTFIPGYNCAHEVLQHLARRRD